MTFSNLNLTDPLVQAVSKKGYSRHEAILIKSISYLLQEKDLFSCTQPGTDSTAAFAMPILLLPELKAKINSGHAIKSHKMVSSNRQYEWIRIIR